MLSKSHHRLKKQKTRENVSLERAMLVVAVIEPLMTIPQIIDLFSRPGQARVSILTWILYMAASIMWFIYGWYHHNVPLILTGALWVIMEALVVFGALYR